MENLRVQISRLQKKNKKQAWLSDEITVGRRLFSFNSSSHQIYVEQELNSHIKPAQLKLASMSQHGERHWPCDRSPKSQSAKAANYDTKCLHSGQVDAGVQEWAEKTLQCSQTRPPGGIRGVQRCSCKCNTIFNNCGYFCFFQYLIFHFLVNKCVYELRLNIQSFHKYLCHICAFCLAKEVETKIDFLLHFQPQFVMPEYESGGFEANGFGTVNSHWIFIGKKGSVFSHLELRHLDK